MQDAVTKVGTMLDDGYDQWREALAKLPDMDADNTAQQVSKPLEGYRNGAIGTLYWRWELNCRPASKAATSQTWNRADRPCLSYESGRYLGVDGLEVRKTHILEFPEKHPKTTHASPCDLSDQSHSNLRWMPSRFLR